MIRLLLFCLLSCLYTNNLLAKSEIDPTTPLSTKKTQQTGKSYMVVTANPLASEVASDMLLQGGNAVDAMVAAQIMLSLVEPQSSGLGGGSFAVYWHAKQRQLTTFDGRETAPADVTPTLFQDKNGQALTFEDAVVGGRSVGTPGTVKLLWDMHQRYGQLPWQALFKPTIKQATEGFIVSPRLVNLIEKSQTTLKKHPATRRYFFTETGQPIALGTRLKNPELTKVLTLLGQQGEKVFYNGVIGQAMVETVRNSHNAGVLSLTDLRNYRTKERTPICTAYHQYQVCGMPPPSSGAITLGQILGILNTFPLHQLGAESAESWRLIADATRLAFADRDLYLADTDYVGAPVQGMLSTQYLSERAQQLKAGQRLLSVKAGTPPWMHALHRAPDQSLELASTTHISIRDQQGNIVSMSSSIEHQFGSGLMVGGFLLNNQLTDFSFQTHLEHRLIANSVSPGKRPRSSMTPTIVFNQDHEPVLILGSPGGSRIIPYVANTLIRILDWQFSPEQALQAPHLINRDGTLEIEEQAAHTSLIKNLKALGYPIDIRHLNSGLHIIQIQDQLIIGAADPRREGQAIGQ